MHRFGLVAAGAAMLFGFSVHAEEIRVEINKINETGIAEPVGVIVAAETAAGLTLTPDLKGLPPGPHGFHVHEFPDCGAKEKDGKPVAGLAAGNHFDPKNTGKHAGPAGDGHVGDLPVLSVAPDGTAKEAVIAKRLRVADLRGHSLMIHAENDNYADKPGGARIACGVAK
ncbi:superoxide dismutase family protein [Methylocaldum sp.]|uniref:superoxide dismutase family protein n=1 Tax=Methylocaldum sp. TaxID=1969727 RepID=UPI002D2F256A|nr:superoxide dismutase family protein [Methylocaldum sp.]HYE37707.1 superoxide dismutase family protein [Methylocaldum sp.]